jgi:hypothetical protein
VVSFVHAQANVFLFFFGPGLQIINIFFFLQCVGHIIANYFVLVMTCSVFSQASSQGKGVDPNTTKYSVKVVPVSEFVAKPAS